ncbi:uncharacterized protein LOC121729761 [Aricia agestis]|uniref:uncharacterized protein LOC121729761 n=1 Tax=Aricia agestis TaxID=91739 RepID=UPI001C20B4A7|nr:uncharacterized protein LOC121729761 [Aricia agestis]
MTHKYAPEKLRVRWQEEYRDQVQEQQEFMQELHKTRRKEEQRILQEIKKLGGPKWFQALSGGQTTALDTLEMAIHQDLLEGRPTRTADVMKKLALYPQPNHVDLSNCVYAGREDPKKMLAHLFLITYGHEFESKRLEYPLNAKLMLSAILYLGGKNLIELLQKMFAPPKETPPVVEKKARRPPKQKSASPYMEKLTAHVYEPKKKDPYKPPPLPNLDFLDDLIEDEPPTKLYQPPTAPTLKTTPRPKKKLAESYCDQLAGIKRIEPHSSVVASQETVVSQPKKVKKRSKFQLSDVNKSYGTDTHTTWRKRSPVRKPTAPTSEIQNVHFAITGVFTLNGKSHYVLGGVCVTPPEGVMIHGGFVCVDGVMVNLHCGFRAQPPPQKTHKCDCVERWQDVALDYVKRTKCRCGHFYDYGNDGTFPPSELPYFEAPTKHLPHRFNYDTIFDLDEKHLHVRKEFKRFWETDSLVHIGDAAAKTDKKKKKIRRSSKSCLGTDPTPSDYLICALKHLRKENIAAKLPDVHLVPELKEWMRHRIHGPLTRKQKERMLKKKSATFWQTLLRLSKKGYGHVYPPKEPAFTGQSDWNHKQAMIEKFRKYTFQYRLELYRSYANVTNMMWPTMFQAEFPDKSFRQIYYSYLFARLEDFHLIHPYSTRETMERTEILRSKRYRCPLSIE